jgi:hypothetical protein
MTTIHTLAFDNVRYLEQAVSLLHTITDDTYAQPAPMKLGSSVGAHLRHCIDHYDNFLAGVPAGRIDYDARRREVLLETSRAAGIEKLNQLIAGLRAVANQTDQSLVVKMDCGDNEAEACWWTDSSVRRELQFLISHTVHHFAIIKMVLIAGGTSVGADFGIAPSTLRYHQGATACAH